jgi:hypothetical protein
VAKSFDPIIQHSVGPISKIAFKATLAAQPGKITCPRSGNDKPRRLDLPVLDNFQALKHEVTLAPAQFSAESLHTDEVGRMIVARAARQPPGGRVMIHQGGQKRRSKGAKSR